MGAVPRQARISRDAVLDVTLELAETQGLDAVSMRKVAARLGVTPMALYHHVRDKDDLLDGLVERLLAELPLPDPTLPWEQRLRQLADALRETAAGHPDAFQMLLRRPVATAGALNVREAVYAALRDAGVPDELVPRAERLLSTFVLGFAASEAGGRFSAHSQAVRDADIEWAWDQIIDAARPARSRPRRRRTS
jgi:AcrR family transcriptional regulator